MKASLAFLFCFLLVAGCRKSDNNSTAPACNIQQAYSDNAKKVTITIGVWGTVSSIEGDCMPTVPACTSCCRNCPVKRTVKIYRYATFNDAVASPQNSSFFDSINTQLITEVETDEEGFFQAGIPAGNYTIVIVENNKLYANSSDGQGGISPFIVSEGRTNVNLAMTYKATF